MAMKTLLIFYVLLGVVSTSFSQAKIFTVAEIHQLEIENSLHAQALIDWKVGDSQDYKVKMGFGLPGSLQKKATKEEGNGIWIYQEMKLGPVKDISELLVDRNTGQVLKFIHNGKEEKVPDTQIEVISIKNESIEVPAGKFKVMHITAKSKQAKQIEMWVNNREIALDGAAKVYLDQGLIKVTMELTKFLKQ